MQWKAQEPPHPEAVNLTDFPSDGEVEDEPHEKLPKVEQEVPSSAVAARAVAPAVTVVACPMRLPIGAEDPVAYRADRSDTSCSVHARHGIGAIASLYLVTAVVGPTVHLETGCVDAVPLGTAGASALTCIAVPGARTTSPLVQKPVHDSLARANTDAPRGRPCSAAGDTGRCRCHSGSLPGHWGLGPRCRSSRPLQAPGRSRPR